MNRIINKYKNELMLSAGFIYSGFIFFTIIESNYKTETAILKRGFDKQIADLKLENEHLKKSLKQ